MVKLRRVLGLWELTVLGLGTIVGAGIYVLIGAAAGIAGNIVWLSFVIAALISYLRGFSYSELASIFPKAGAEYTYITQSFGDLLGFLTGWMIIFGGLFSIATVALGFGGYFVALFGGDQILISLLLIVVLSAINFYGIKESAITGIAATLVEVFGLLLIIWIGLPYIGNVDYFEMPNGIDGVIGAAALVFFAFLGYGGIVRLSEETRNPRENIPKAIFISITLAMILYALIAIVAVSVVDWRELGSSSAPLAEVAEKAFGKNASKILTIIALFATANTVLFSLISVSRIIYGMGSEYSLPKELGKIHPTRRTPWVAIVVTMLFSIAFMSIGKIETVANITNLSVFITFFLVNLAVIRLRYKPGIKRTFKIPLNIGKFPIFPAIASLICIVMIASFDLTVISAGVILILSGLLAYKFLKGHRLGIL